MKNGDDFSPAVIRRVAGLLDEFRDGEELTLSQLAARTGLPRSSVHRLLARLIELGWVGRRGRAYALSRAMFEWGALAQQHDRLQRAAHPVLHELHATSGLIVHLAVLDGDHVRYLDKVGYGPIELPSRIGGRLPALRTALGKALLAQSWTDPATIGATAQAGVPTLARHEIARIRQQRVAYEQESVAGVTCIATTIGNGRTCAGALSVTGPADRVDNVMLPATIRAAAHVIWRSLGEREDARQAS